MFYYSGRQIRPINTVSFLSVFSRSLFMRTQTHEWSYCSLKVYDWSIWPSLKASAILVPSGPNVLRDDKID